MTRDNSDEPIDGTRSAGPHDPPGRGGGPINRRRVLAGGAALSVVAVSVISLSQKLTDTAFLRRLLERLAGPFEMEDGEFAAFANDFRDTFDELDSLKTMPLRALERARLLHGLEDILPSHLAERIEVLERRLLTSFATTTNFIKTARGMPITFIGPAACTNPFADTSPPD